MVSRDQQITMILCLLPLLNRTTSLFYRVVCVHVLKAEADFSKSYHVNCANWAKSVLHHQSPATLVLTTRLPLCKWVKAWSHCVSQFLAPVPKSHKVERDGWADNKSCFLYNIPTPMTAQRNWRLKSIKIMTTKPCISWLPLLVATFKVKSVQCVPVHCSDSPSSVKVLKNIKLWIGGSLAWKLTD